MKKFNSLLSLHNFFLLLFLLFFFWACDPDEQKVEPKEEPIEQEEPEEEEEEEEEETPAEEEETEEDLFASPVERYGQLRVEGNQIVDQEGNPVQLRGMSFFWSQWMGQFYQKETVQWLKDDWRCTIVRAAMAVDHDGYLKNPEKEKQKVITVVDAAIEQGLYVIIDWHDHHAENHTQEAKIFFAQMAQLYGEYPNVIYEPYNEPERSSWSEAIKPYHEAIIDTIRHYDLDNIVVCGSREWSQQVLEAANDPIEDENVAYSLHFYAATHGKWLRDRAQQALDKGIALMVTEYGTSPASGDGPLDIEETKAWWSFMDEKNISWCNWSITDKNESSAALKPGASATGGWDDAAISTSGKLVRDELRDKNPAPEGE